MTGTALLPRCPRTCRQKDRTVSICFELMREANLRESVAHAEMALEVRGFEMVSVNCIRTST